MCIEYIKRSLYTTYILFWANWAQEPCELKCETGGDVGPLATASSPLHLHLVTTTTMSMSELANALTLPVPVSSYGGYVQQGEEEQARFQQPAASSMQEDRQTIPTPAPPG